MHTLQEGGHEVFELCSDSGSDAGHDSDVEVTVELTVGPLVFRACFIRLCWMQTVPSDVWEDESSDLVEYSEMILPRSSTPGSSVLPRKLPSSDRIEYLTEVPSISGMFRTPTAVVIEFSDPKFNIIDPRVGEVMTLDSLVGDSDNDSWKASSGTGSSKAEVIFVPGEPAIECRRAGSECRGTFACDKMDPTVYSHMGILMMSCMVRVGGLFGLMSSSGFLDPGIL
ncbi:hypothetical protein B0H19DRAFT_1371192 [Mycena capillaripes]|nr:hypothetical protein B0H19DRAFT_1371192 [Mycena capillaripes]